MAATLNARPRTETGKGVARRLRLAGDVPAVIYGHGDKNQSLAVNGLELEKLLAGISVENTIIDLQIEGGAGTQALIREVQYHPARPVILHVDFYQIHAGEKIHLEVPIRLHGTPVGVRVNGGVMQEVLRDLHVECLPKDIPQAVDVDVENLDVGGSVLVGDITIPNVKILNDPDIVLVTVSAPTVADLPAAPETELGVGEVEPELVRGRRADAEETASEQGSGGRPPQ